MVLSFENKNQNKITNEHQNIVSLRRRERTEHWMNESRSEAECGQRRCARRRANLEMSKVTSETANDDGCFKSQFPLRPFPLLSCFPLHSQVFMESSFMFACTLEPASGEWNSRPYQFSSTWHCIYFVRTVALDVHLLPSRIIHKHTFNLFIKYVVNCKQYLLDECNVGCCPWMMISVMFDDRLICNGIWHNGLIRICFLLLLVISLQMKLRQNGIMIICMYVNGWKGKNEAQFQWRYFSRAHSWTFPLFNFYRKWKELTFPVSMSLTVQCHNYWIELRALLFVFSSMNNIKY